MSHFCDYIVNYFSSSGWTLAANLKLTWYDRGNYPRAVSRRCLDKAHPKSVCIPQERPWVPRRMDRTWQGKAAGGWVKAWMSVPRAASLWNPSWQMCCFPPCLPLQLLLAYQVAPTLAESKKREVVNTAQQHANYNHLHPEDGGWQVYKREVERHGRSLWVTWNPASNMAN